MGRAIELITGLNTAPGATMTAATVLTGNSFTIRDSKRAISMPAVWATRQGAGAARITSPLMHDNTLGIQCEAGAASSALIDWYVAQPLHSQDQLSVQQTGSAVAGDLEFVSFLAVYDDLPGVAGTFIDRAELLRRTVNLYSNQITIASGTTGQYTGSAAVNSNEDTFKANTDYALLGYQVITSAAHAIRFVGPDWGNLGVGGPGFVSTVRDDTKDWFVMLAELTGSKTIPVMNASNRALTTIDCVVDENGANPVVMMLWAELS